nr:hypothetical protein GCM10023233_25620 [Brevibacterium otitidis]
MPVQYVAAAPVNDCSGAVSASHFAAGLRGGISARFSWEVSSKVVVTSARESPSWVRTSSMAERTSSMLCRAAATFLARFCRRERLALSASSSVSEVAELLEVQPATLSRYKLPEPDALIGRTRGWRRETIVEWNASRPGRGWRKGQPDSQ